MLHEVDSEFIDDMLQQMAMAKTYYHEQLRKRLRNTRKAKNIQTQRKMQQKQKNQSNSMQGKSPAFSSPAKSQQPSKFLSTFVNIKHARYQIGPTQTYNYKNIEFPNIGNKKSHISKPKQNPQIFDQSYQLMNSSIKSIEKSYVKQSWNRYININNLNKSYERNNGDGARSKNRGLYRRTKKDTTEENIEGWKSFYNFDVDADINAVAKV